MRASSLKWIFFISAVSILSCLWSISYSGTIIINRGDLDDREKDDREHNLLKRKILNSDKSHVISNVLKLHWTSVHVTGKYSYHFISAYFDNRETAPGRPAVIVIGYVNRTIHTNLYCGFRFPNGSRTCSDRPAIQQKVNRARITDVTIAKPIHCICSLSTNDDESPLFVTISNSSKCDPMSTSGMIPVRNRHRYDTKHKVKKFGVCLEGPVIRNSHTLQDLVEFIEMSQLLGAELITIYVGPMQLDGKDLQYISDAYHKTVNFIEWRSFKKHHPLHYYGQLPLISDCLYRNMHEVEYLAMIDLDEMILPTKDRNWAEMIDKLKRNKNFASFMFLNRYFTAVKEQGMMTTPSLPECKNKIPKYFTKCSASLCHFHYYSRTKLIMRPKAVLRASVHRVTASLPAYKMTYKVPARIGISAHYKEEIGNIHGCPPVHKLTKNNIALKFKDMYVKKYC